MPRRETLNNANRAKIMAETFGHSNNFATLSQVLTYNKLSTNSPPTGAAKYTTFLCRNAREAAMFL